MKQTLKYLTSILAILALFTGCNREFEWEGFGVNNDDSEEHCIKLEKDSEGSTNISVYSDGAWTAELENDPDWASLSNASGKGNGYITFNYKTNREAIRRAFILVHSKGETKRIMVVQNGADIIFRFRAEDGDMIIEKEATTYYLALDANISNDLYKHVVLDEVQYNEDEGWIGDVKMVGEQLSLNVAANDTGNERSARLGITLTDPHTKLVYGPSYVNITQTTSSSVDISWEALFARYEAATDRNSDGSWVIKTEGEEEANGIKISGVSLSFPENTNAAMNAQSSWSGSGFAVTDTANNDATNYFMSEDGAYSMLLRMDSANDNVLPQYAKAQIRVNGAKLRKLGDGRYMLSDIRSRNIVSIVKGSEQNVPVVERTISELSSNDYYRIVTLKDVELVYNKGAFYNTTDGYRYACDYYPTMLRDKSGNTIYMMFNYSAAYWVRNGKAAPCGSGDVKGIITYETSPRYGANPKTVDGVTTGKGSLGAFVIRPFDESCLMFNDNEQQNFSATHTEWCWNDSNLVLDGNAALAKVGEGKVYHELDVKPVLGPNFNGLTYSTSSTGTQIADAACAFSSNWCDAEGNLKGIIFEFNAKTLGAGASLNIAYWGGSQATSGVGINFPANWKLEYSTDGVTYTAIEGAEIDIHPFVWWTSSCPTFATHGLAQRSFLLPAELSGVEKAYVRLAPYNNICASLSDPEGSTFSSKSSATGLYLAAVSIKYNK